MNKLRLLPKFVYAEIYFIVWSFNKFSFALGTISKIIINIELNKLKDIKYLNQVTLNVKYLYIYLINKKRTDSFVWRNQSFGRSKKSSIKVCYFDIYFFKITKDFAGTLAGNVVDSVGIPEVTSITFV